MTDEVMPQMAIQLIVVVVKMISVKCAFLSALKIVYLLTLFFLLPQFFYTGNNVADQHVEIHSLCVMCACQVKRRKKYISFYTLVACIKHFNFTLQFSLSSLHPWMEIWVMIKSTLSVLKELSFCIKEALKLMDTPWWRTRGCY